MVVFNDNQANKMSFAFNATVANWKKAIRACGL